MKILVALACAAFAAACLNASSQTRVPDASNATACPLATELPVQSLYGRWRAEFSDTANGVLRETATLRFEPNPDYAESVSGNVQRGGTKAQVSGDAEDGEFALDESADGVSISATWVGRVVPDSCGREIRGLWTDTVQNKQLDFVLRKLPENSH